MPPPSRVRAVDDGAPIPYRVAPQAPATTGTERRRPAPTHAEIAGRLGDAPEVRGGFEATPCEPGMVGSELATIVNLLGVATLAARDLDDEEDSPANDLHSMLFDLRLRMRGVYDAYLASPAPAKPHGRTERPEAAAIGDFEAYPRTLDDASTATMLAHALAPFYTAELLPEGIAHVANELAVLAQALDSRSDLDVAPSTLHAVVSGYERRLRILSAVARKTIARLDDRRSA